MYGGIALSKPYESYESGDYLSKNPTWDEEDSEWKAKQVISILEKNGITPNTIVEVGCGAGGILAALYDTFPSIEYSGFEIAPDASQFWVKHASKNINYSVSDFLIKKTDKYDLLLLLDVFEHVQNPFEFLLKLQGRADYYVFHIPLDLSAISVARETPLLYVREKVGHIHSYTKGLALALLEESGYQIIDWTYTGAAFTTPQRNWKTRLVSAIRHIAHFINKDFGVRLLGGETLMVLAKPESE